MRSSAHSWVPSNIKINAHTQFNEKPILRVKPNILVVCSIRCLHHRQNDNLTAILSNQVLSHFAVQNPVDILCLGIQNPSKTGGIR